MVAAQIGEMLFRFLPGLLRGWKRRENSQNKGEETGVDKEMSLRMDKRIRGLSVGARREIFIAGSKT
jgi:hypothetical protein